LTVGSLFVNGLIAASMQIALVVLILDTFDRSFAMLGLAFACVALGTLLGPLPIPRLLVRLSPALLLAGGAGAIVVALAVAVYAPWSGVVLAVAFASGLLGVTNEAVASLAIRRAVPVVQLDDALRVMRRGVSAGQLCALIGAVLIAELWVGDVTIVAITVACLTLIGVLFLHDGGGDLVSRTTRRTGQRA
jgi:hypothetical protein